MNLLMMRFCKQLRYSVYSNINNVLRRYNCVSNNEKSIEKSIEKPNNASSIIKSIKFPGYTVIYSFPHIMYAKIFNRVKYGYTIVLSATIPVYSILQILDVLSLEENLNLICLNSLLILTLHTGGYMCNNVVGSMCYKADSKYLEDQELIISYIDYWGKRIDFQTTVNNVTPFTDNPYISNKLFELLNVKSCNKNLKLKMYMKYGKITEKLAFYQIFGDVSK